MKVLIINIDSKIPNLALKKIEKYHLLRGNDVYWDYPLMVNIVDKIYVSAIYSWNKNKAKEYECYPIAEIGGPGFDISKKLPPKIDNIKLRINIGFTTRGCIRKCPFCIVPLKEGKLKREDHISDIWDGKSDTIELLDNNWLADKEWFFENSNFLIKHKIKLKENGMDLRLVDEDIADQLSKIKWAKQPHWAWDNLQDESIVESKIKLLKKCGVRKGMIYILTGFNTTFQEDIYRRNKIIGWGYDCFVMIYNKKKDRLLQQFARWNNRYFFKNITFEEYLQHKNYKEV
ncbi:MAG TPA: hypothetical protein ENI52_01260 [Thermoplasmata archaeon]|nr:hypothetical protein [Thermoplasmata archaeon]